MDSDIPVIVLSDDEDENEQMNDSSVLIVDDIERNQDIPKSNEIVDEDLTVIYSQKAHVLPHARYDCTLPFRFVESSVSGPESDNASYCEQCFCYICDKPASTGPPFLDRNIIEPTPIQATQCRFWTAPCYCHCNAHKRSVYWKTLRDKAIMGYLCELNFNFSPTDMDADLRHAETSLLQFSCVLNLKYTTFLTGLDSPNQPNYCHCRCHTNNGTTAQSRSAGGNRQGCSGCQSQHLRPECSYTAVRDYILAYLEEARNVSPKTAAVILLGAMKLFITHSAPGPVYRMVAEMVRRLFLRSVSSLQMLIVDADLPASFTKPLQEFFQTLPLPPDCRWLKSSLNVLPWNDPLLSAVLKGQNVTGERQVNRRRPEVLFEMHEVIRARVHKLQQQNKFRELARYLKVVKSSDFQALQAMRDWVPLYLCKVGDFPGAIDAMLRTTDGASCPASRLLPAQLCAYLTILMSSCAPAEVPRPYQVDFDPLLSSSWQPLEGEPTPLKRLEVLKFALRVLNSNNKVLLCSQSWVDVLHVAHISRNTPSLPEPSKDFQLRTKDKAKDVLTELSYTFRLQIPKNFQNEFPDQALAILATQALVFRLFQSRLSPALKVIMSYKSNIWAVQMLLEGLSERPEVLQDLLYLLLEELLDHRRPFLRKQDADEQAFIGHVLCLLFVTFRSSVVLGPDSYHGSELIARWNELDNPWQIYLRKELEYNEALLTPEKQRLLRRIQQRDW